MKILAVPGCNAFRGIMGIIGRHVSPSRHRIRHADAVNSSAFGYRLAGGNEARAAGDAISRINAAQPVRARTAGQHHASGTDGAPPRAAASCPLIPQSH